MSKRAIAYALCLLVLDVARGTGMRAQQERRLLYTALPGVGGLNDMKYGGAGILVFDIDNGHKFLKRVPLQGAAAPVQEAIKGIAAHAATARLYVSTSRRLAAYDLLTDKLVWEQSYQNRGIDRVTISPDGKTLYAPSLGAPKLFVADAATGALVAALDKVGTAHNALASDDGRFVYLESQGRTRMMVVADAKTNTLVKEIGPFDDVARPFTINGKQTLLFANVNNLLGFEVADLNTGNILHRVEVPGVTGGRSPTHGIPSHGIAMTQDETEIWVADNANNYLRIFDATTMPPTMKASVKVRDEPGWITFGIDGRLAYPSTGDVIDVRTKQIVGALQDENNIKVETEKILEIDFSGEKPIRVGNQFGIGMKK